MNNEIIVKIEEYKNVNAYKFVCPICGFNHIWINKLPEKIKCDNCNASFEMQT